MFFLKDTTQWRRWGSNPRPFGQALYHWATALPGKPRNAKRNPLDEFFYSTLTLMIDS